MRYIIIILIFSTSVCFGQAKEPLEGKPKTFEETFAYLDQMFDDTATYNFMLFPEDVAISRLHFPFGMWVRNNWGLWKESELKTFFNDHGVYQPDAMSSIIFTSYYRHLHNKPIDFQGQVERLKRINSNIQVDTLDNGSVQVSYPELEKEDRTTTEELFKYYPVGDTVLVTLTGKKGLFRRSVTFKGMATIKGHIEDKLLLTLIMLKKDDKVKTDYKVGEEINAWNASCTLIPPKNWKK